MRAMLFSLGLIAATAVMSGAHGHEAAIAECKQERSADGKSACLTRQLPEVEKELAQTVQQLLQQTRRQMPSTSGENVTKSLQTAERRFADWRSAHCQWLLASVGEKDPRGQTWQNCFIRLTEHHTAELKRQLIPAAVPPKAAARTGAAKR